jgi:glutamine synthetase
VQGLKLMMFSLNVAIDVCRSKPYNNWYFFKCQGGFMLHVAEYIWLDGRKPTQQIRAKSRVLRLPEQVDITNFPIWSFDGSSTNQATTTGSDCYLRPVYFCNHPFDNGFVVLCEVLNDRGEVHQTNTRAKLRETLSQVDCNPWLGFEQEYTLFENDRPLGWPEHGSPEPQGPYYCAVGTRQVFGREFALVHQNLCLEAGLMYFGMNAEVMPGQWEFQIGYRGGHESADALKICDQLWVARWIMHRLSEDFGYDVSLHNKPMQGDWNGSGMHTNYSDDFMRDTIKGLDAIKQVMPYLEKAHSQHIQVYGEGLEKRLTGLHETAPIDQFSWGVGSRNTSVRIPKSVWAQGSGYIEDRRPGANADPYLVAEKLIQTIAQATQEKHRSKL